MDNCLRKITTVRTSNVLVNSIRYVATHLIVPNFRKPRRMDLIMKLRLEQAKKDKPKLDVHFNSVNLSSKYKVQEVLNALKAFDIWMNEALIMQLEVNMGEKKSKLQHLRGNSLLPFSHGKETVVLAFAEGKLADQAKEFGADIVGGEELIPLIKAGELEFDQCVSTLDFLPKLKDMQNILRKKMPNIKRGSATDDLRAPIELYKNGILYEADREGRIELQIGKMSHSESNLTANLKAIMNEICTQSGLPKDDFFQRLILTSDQGPKFSVDFDELI